ncbi:hypothetical protein AB0L06_00645 [Spirillospora sp. NPDC052269]
MPAPEPEFARPVALSLREIVRDDGPLSAASVRTLATDLARTLAASATAHGNLSPDTVLLTPDGPRFADGTEPDPACMPPEQTREHDLIPPTDIFALGAVLAYATTGRSPFGEGSAELIAYRIAYHAPDLNGLPDDLRELVASCLAKDPSARPTATDLAVGVPSAPESPTIVRLDTTRPDAARLTDTIPNVTPLADDPEPPWPTFAADPREALLSQLAGSMQSVLTNSATAFAALRDRQAVQTAPKPEPKAAAPAVARHQRSQSPHQRSSASTDPLEYRGIPSPRRPRLRPVAITNTNRGKQRLYALLGMLLGLVVCLSTSLRTLVLAYPVFVVLGLLIGGALVSKRDVLTVSAQGLHIRQREKSPDRRRLASFRIDWDDLQTIRIAVDKKNVRVLVYFAAPRREAWFQDNNVRPHRDGYEIFKVPCANRSETSHVATRIRRALEPFTETY